MTTPPASRFGILAHQVRPGEMVWIPGPDGAEISSKLLCSTPETGPEGQIRIRLSCASGSIVVGADETVSIVP